MKQSRRGSSPAQQAKAARHRSTSGWTVGALATASAVGGALAGCHPTGTPVVDPFYAGALAAMVAAAGSRSRRWTWLTLGAAAVVLSRGWLLAPAAIALIIAFAAVWPRRGNRRLGALVGALAIQVILRWPSTGFHDLTALVAAAAICPCLISAYRRSPASRCRIIRRAVAGIGSLAVILTVPFAVGALRVRATVSHGVASAEVALSAVNAGDTATTTRQLPSPANCRPLS